jgi:hypothetical protein
MAKKKRKEMGFLETRDFRSLSTKHFGKDVKELNAGGRG